MAHDRSILATNRSGAGVKGYTAVLTTRTAPQSDSQDRLFLPSDPGKIGSIKPKVPVKFFRLGTFMT